MSSASEEVPTELKKLFWKIVILLNIGLLTASLGVMFLYFKGNVPLFVGLSIVGYAALARGIYLYRKKAPSRKTGKNP